VWSKVLYATVRKLFAGTERSAASQMRKFESWANDGFLGTAFEPPPRAPIFTIEQLELHAFTLAKSYKVGKYTGGVDLLGILDESEKDIDRCHRMMSEDHASGIRLPPAAVWLLDNHYLVEEKVSISKKQLPIGFRRRLPQLVSGSAAGLPRIYDLMDQLVCHMDGMIDEESLSHFIKSFQGVTPLTLGELWATPVMLRLSLIQSLKRVTASIIWQRGHRDRALTWTKRINSPTNRQDLIMQELADMIKENPPLTSAYVSQFVQTLNSCTGSTSAFIMSWLEQRLAEQGKTIEEALRVESERESSDQASMSNSFAGLRFIDAMDWGVFLERHSCVDEVLRLDPAGTYPVMDFETRNQYRSIVESLARRVGAKEHDVARLVLELAQERRALESHSVEHHVGYFLLDDGRSLLESRLRGRSRFSFGIRNLCARFKLLLYLSAVVAVAFLVATGLAHQSGAVDTKLFPLLLILSLLVSTQFAVVIVNWTAMLARSPKPIPRMDFEFGIPERCRTMVIVPSVLSSPSVVSDLLEGLELRHLANRDANLWFGLLTDFCDADCKDMEGDKELLDQAIAGIADLNVKYGKESQDSFFLLHRPRLFNPKENCWMGRERKRGKIEDFNALIFERKAESFCYISSPLALLESVSYVITLDADTNLSWGGGWRLVAAAAHPLNQPVLSEDGRSILRGYAILQPRVSISLNSSRQSRYSRILAGDVGLDPYTKLVSDVYQDLFGEASYIGKGIYEVNAFRRVLGGRFPENAILSHDLLESCYAKTGQCSDVELLEKAPAHYLTDVSRRHRWMRGDWQVAPWLAQGDHQSTGKLFLAALGRWKIFDNLRLSLVAPSYMVILILGWMTLDAPGRWTSAVLSLLILPEVLPVFADMWARPEKIPLRIHLSGLHVALRERLAKVLLWIVFLPFEAQISLDAIFRSIWRMCISKKRLLEWQTSDSAECNVNSKIFPVLRRMWIGPLISISIFAVLIEKGSLGAFVAAAPILVLWFVSPLAAWWVSIPTVYRTALADESDWDFLREAARRSWRYFDKFADAADHYLPPDNVQFSDEPRIAHRTSPTNIGLSMLSSLAAFDLGYLTVSQLLARTERLFSTLESMERYRGHFLNWYDTLTLEPLLPKYVSLVDSGNFVGHLRVFRTGLAEVASGAHLETSKMRDAMLDSIRLLSHELRNSSDPNLAKYEVSLAEVRSLLSRDVIHPHEQLHWMNDILALALRFQELAVYRVNPEVGYWFSSFKCLVEAHREELIERAPWIAFSWGPPEGRWWSWATKLSLSSQTAEVLSLAKAALADLADCKDENAELYHAFQIAGEFAEKRIQSVQLLTDRAQKLGQVDFSFLYNSRRKLFSIGYWVDDRRLDPCYYDLLASEARFASYIAVAEGQIPFDHWFSLGRKMTTSEGQQVLLSWSGSMFEYLMPLVVMPSFGGSLLDRSCRVAVSRQIQYASQRNVPWGISESCYSVTDIEGTYQYRAFGIPGLGLQRGLGDDLVISPYSTLLALAIDPERACENLRKFASQDILGAYGFFEAIDYTSTRLQKSQQNIVVQSVMAHHQGMGLLSLCQSIRGPVMQQRFLANADFKAAAALLHEKIPKGNVLIHPYARESRIVRPGLDSRETLPLRHFTKPSGAYPEVHLLSNGRYHVMVSSSGGGYSCAGEVSLTRWREDSTVESSGPTFYVADIETESYWTNAFLPCLSSGSRYEAIFLPGRAEFRRHDEGVETHTDIAVSTEDDLEVRRLRITNRTNRSRRLMITGFTEVVLAQRIADELHMAFSNIFVQTEVIRSSNAILAHRRPRSNEETSIWMFAVLQSSDTGVGSASFDTNRMRCIGRGRSAKNPIMMDIFEPFAENLNDSMDPCMAIRRTIDLDEDATVTIDFILGSAPSKEEAMNLVLKYQDHRMADRVFQVAPTYSMAVLSHIGATETEALLFEALASGIVFPLSCFRAPSSTLRRNRKGQSWLWRFGISGDIPIVLLRVSSSDNLQIVRDVLRAHAYWRMKGLQSDLVILNEDSSGYRRVLQDEILSLVSAGTEAHLIDKKGGIFIRPVENFSDEDRVLILAVSRVVLIDRDGTLEQQLRDRKSQAESARASAMFTGKQLISSFGSIVPSARTGLSKSASQEDLVFDNGIGGFASTGREYVVHCKTGERSPMPWVNVISNSRLGTVISESGSAYTWFGNSQLFRISPWSNDAVSDPSGERLFLRDVLSGQFFSLSPLQSASSAPYTCRHGIGYTTFEHREIDLDTRLDCFVAINSPVKFMRVRILNRSSRKRLISLFASIDLVLGDLKSRHAMNVVTELETLTGAILARNFYNTDFANSVVFLDCSESVRSVSGDRLEFLGCNEDPGFPDALLRRGLSDRLGAGLDPCASMQVQVELASGSEREVVFILGAGSSSEEAVGLIKKWRGCSAAGIAFEEVERFWKAKTGTFRANTPDKALNIVMNAWLPYQVLSCRLWGRSGFYQSGGAFGFRDQLQDCLALLHQMPELARSHILRCASRQFVEGDVQHWWHPPCGRGVRTHCSDDYLWLPYAVCKYVEVTGDKEILAEQVSFLFARKLTGLEESIYDMPETSDQTESLFEHCVRALEHGLTYGSHGIPLIGSGDWNDGMNRVGHEGKGESVWLGFFLHEVLMRFSELSAACGKHELATKYLAEAKQLAVNVDGNCWDGEWYVRAYFDDGSPVGSERSDECKIDSLSQSWATIAQVGSPERRAMALDSVWKKLVRHDLKIVQLFDPPYRKTASDPGYIKGYPPGVRENAGQYTHATVWAAWAYALAGQNDRASKLISYINPINHALNLKAAEKYRVEPYVIAADISSQMPYQGRGGWTWYTGSASWYYRLLCEVVFGVRKVADSLSFEPHPPTEWSDFSLEYRFESTVYDISFKRVSGSSSEDGVWLNGEKLPNGSLALLDTGKKEKVTVYYQSQNEANV
jgi:cyclic beta-1,2-glucan synthetase